MVREQVIHRVFTCVAMRMVALCCLAFFLNLSQAVNFTLGFEKGDLRGWHVVRGTGNAFRCQPTRGDAPRARKRETANHHGQYWIGTFECNNKKNSVRHRSQSRSGIQGDRPKGILRSANFRVPRAFLHFRVGGGNTRATEVQLYIHNGTGEFKERIRFYESGRNSETMHEVKWDLRPYAGETAHIQIVDMSSKGWGHINVDYFRFNYPDRSVRGVRVPNLINKSQQRASGLLRSLRLRLGEIKYIAVNRTPNTIVRQNPKPGARVPVGSAVALYIAKNSFIRVPNVTGQLYANAKDRLYQSRLKVDVIRKVESGERVGTVLTQSPRAGSKVRLGTTISLELAKKSLILVPNVIGQHYRNASELLSRSSLFAGDISYVDSDQRQGAVLAQRPNAGSRVKSGTAISLEVAKSKKLKAPNLSGLTLDRAKDKLYAKRLILGKVSRQESEEKVGLIIDQTPQAGVAIKANSSINVSISVANSIIVPSVHSLTKSQARIKLVSAGLKFGFVTYRESTSHKAGEVLEQSPVAGTKVDRNSQVTLVLSKTKLVVVPSIHGLSFTEAAEKLKKSGLLIGHVKQANTENRKGLISKQNPRAGHKVRYGSLVNLVIISKKKSYIIPWKQIGLGVVGFAGVILILRLLTKLVSPKSDVMGAGGALHIKPIIDKGKQSIELNGNLVKGEDDDQ